MRILNSMSYAAAASGAARKKRELRFAPRSCVYCGAEFQPPNRMNPKRAHCYGWKCERRHEAVHSSKVLGYYRARVARKKAAS